MSSLRKILSSLFPLCLCTQSPSASPANGPVPTLASLEGKWLGTLSEGREKWRVGLEVFSHPDGSPQAVFHHLDHGATDLRLKDLSLTGPVLRGTLLSVPFTLEGKVSSDGKRIQGHWHHAKKSPLTLERVEAFPAGFSRPQTPEGPRPYRQEVLFYPNSAANLHLAATLTLPEGKGPFPAVLLIPGSGESDRDASYDAHRPFKVLADHLTRQGFAVLRADKRGCGRSGGIFNSLALTDFASDALAGIAYLKNRTDIDPRCIALVGHSEGGAVAAMAAAQAPAVTHVALLGGEGMPVRPLMVAQMTAGAKAEGATPEQVKVIHDYVSAILEAAQSTPDPKAFQAKASALQQKLTGKDKKALQYIGWPHPEDMLDPAWVVAHPECRAYLAFDVSTHLQKVKCPVLAMGGDKDWIVPTAENLSGIAAALKAGGNAQVTLKTLPNLNHMFQTCHTGAASESDSIEETLAPVAMQTLTEWLKHNIKS